MSLEPLTGLVTSIIAGTTGLGIANKLLYQNKSDIAPAISLGIIAGFGSGLLSIGFVDHI